MKSWTIGYLQSEQKKDAKQSYTNDCTGEGITASWSYGGQLMYGEWGMVSCVSWAPCGLNNLNNFTSSTTKSCPQLSGTCTHGNEGNCIVAQSVRAQPGMWLVYELH